MEKYRHKEPDNKEVVDGQYIIKDRHDNIVENNHGEVLVGAVLDNESIVKRNLGKVAYGAELSTGIEQLLHPEIGAAVEYTGKFWRNPYKRVAVSMEPIMAVVYADNPRKAGDYVRKLHEGIHGKDQSGNKFNALSPDAFYWAHETFRSGVEKTANYYSKDSFTDEDREKLQLESATWFSYYGMPMGHVPEDYLANEEYRQHVIEDKLSMNPSAERAIDMALNRQPPRPENVPAKAWWLARIAMLPVTEIVSLLTIGEIDDKIRDKFDIPFSDSEQKSLDDLRFMAREVLDSMPDSLKYSPQAYASMRRDRGGEHKTPLDSLICTGRSIGISATRRVVNPVNRFVKTIF